MSGHRVELVDRFALIQLAEALARGGDPPSAVGLMAEAGDMFVEPRRKKGFGGLAMVDLEVVDYRVLGPIAPKKRPIWAINPGKNEGKIDVSN